MIRREMTLFDMIVVGVIFIIITGMVFVWAGRGFEIIGRMEKICAASGQEMRETGKRGWGEPERLERLPRRFAPRNDLTRDTNE